MSRTAFRESFWSTFCPGICPGYPATMDVTILAVRKACLGTLIGVSTGAWIEGNERRTLACIDGWGELPDYASVNLEEPDAQACRIVRSLQATPPWWLQTGPSCRRWRQAPQTV